MGLGEAVELQEKATQRGKVVKIEDNEGGRSDLNGGKARLDG
jgi:hypothetical protein